MNINIQKLTQELMDAGIQTSGCNSDGVVWGVDYTEIPGQIEVIFNEIQGRADVKAIIEAHDPIEYSLLPATQMILANGLQTARVEVNSAPDSTVTLLVSGTPIQVTIDSNGCGVTDPISCTTSGAIITVTGQSGSLASCQAVIYVI